MISHLVWKGFAVGFLAAIPLGPMGMICVQRTLAHGRLAGLVSACGLTVAAAFWCVVAAHGLNAVAGLMVGREAILTFALGVFLVAAGGWGLVQGRQESQSSSPIACTSLAGQFTSSLLGVALNPITFLTMTAVLAMLGGIQAHLGRQGMAGLAGGVFLGGMTVWVCITCGIGLMRGRLGEGSRVCLSQFLNGAIVILGVAYMVRPFLPEAMG